MGFCELRRQKIRKTIKANHTNTEIFDNKEIYINLSNYICTCLKESNLKFFSSISLNSFIFQILISKLHDPITFFKIVYK